MDNQNTLKTKRVLIIGATRGLGLALAQHYLAIGCQVTILGRDVSQIPTSIHIDYPHVTCASVDVGDQMALAEFFSSLEEVPELCIYNAGYYFNQRKQRLTLAETKQMLAVNKFGFDDCFRIVSQKMLVAGRGHLVAIASVAGTIRSKRPSLYAMLKAQMIHSALDYRATLQPFGINVTVIAPGYIDTPRLRELNGGDATHKPFLVSQATAVAEITQAIQTQRELHIFPKPMKYISYLLNLLPVSITEQIVSKRK